MIFHVPRKHDRAHSAANLRAVFASLREVDPGFEFVCLSEMAGLAEAGGGGVPDAKEYPRRAL